MNKTIVEANFYAEATADSPESNWVVIKFGGTSVSTAEHWATIAAVVRNRLAVGLKPVLVHSALQGVSSGLEEITGISH